MTIDVSTKWIVEVFPFDSPIPSSGDFPKPSFGPMTSGEFAVASAPINVDKLVGNTLGVTAVNLNRSKGSPDGHCSVSIVGPLPPMFYVGAWAIVSSIHHPKFGGKTTLVRFIGQIENIDISYNVADSSLMYMLSSIKIREWSSMLRMLVRYDVLSITGSASPLGKAAAAVKLLGASIGTSGAEASYNEIEQFMSSAWNPYEMAHLVLKLIGAMNAQDAISTTDDAVSGKLPNIATTAPFVPKALLNRLGMTFGNSKNPFESGFMRVITGIQDKPFFNKGDWDGVFSSPFIDDFVESYKNGYLNNTTHPLTYGLQAMVSQGASAWDILTTQCDNSVNEVYTDFLYEELSSESVVANPVIVIRNKPFMLKKIQKGLIDGITIEADLSKFAVYDDLPRHYLSEESILTFRINSTFLNSPNYIRVNYSPAVGLNRTGEGAALAAGLERLSPEMERFGGNEMEMTTIYNGTEINGVNNEDGRKGGTLDDWYQQLKSLAKAWYSYNYRMASGILVLKENNFPLSIGNNIQFQFGQYKLVGHIEAIQCDFQVEADGLNTNVTTVTLTHIVQATGDGSLDFVDMTHFGNLLQSTPTESAVGSGISLGKFTNVAKSALSAVKGLIS